MRLNVPTRYKEAEQEEKEQDTQSVNVFFRFEFVSLPMCNTGYVYMLLSMRNKKYISIGKTNSIRRRIREHNTGERIYESMTCCGV